MTGLALLTAADCHLCQHGRETLNDLAVDWREVVGDSEEGRALAETAPPLRPVLYDDGRVIAYGRLSARRLRKQLAHQRVRSCARAGEGPA